MRDKQGYPTCIWIIMSFSWESRKGSGFMWMTSTSFLLEELLFFQTSDTVLLKHMFILKRQNPLTSLQMMDKLDKLKVKSPHLMTANLNKKILKLNHVGFHDIKEMSCDKIDFHLSSSDLQKFEEVPTIMCHQVSTSSAEKWSQKPKNYSSWLQIWVSPIESHIKMPNLTTEINMFTALYKMVLFSS